MNVLLIGPPGSGKGTQGERLADRLGLEHIAAGDLLRAEVDAGTDLGRRVQAYLASGELVPDELIVELMLPQVVRAAHDGGYILDGFPRSVPQAIAARKLADEAGITADAAIYLDAPRAELVARITARAQEEGRLDDTPDVVATRLQVYAESTLPLIDYYRGRGILHTIDAGRGEDDVTAAILDALDLAAI